MLKKLCLIGGLAISFIIGLLCFLDAVSAFVASSLPGRSESVGLGVGYLLVSLALFGASLAGLALFIVFSIKNKESIIPSILVLACAGILFIGYFLIISIDSFRNIARIAEYIDGAKDEYLTYYIGSIFYQLLRVGTSFVIFCLVAACGVFSMITLKKKKVA